MVRRAHIHSQIVKSQARAFGAPGGGHHEHVKSDHANMQYQIPTEADIRY